LSQTNETQIEQAAVRTRNKPEKAGGRAKGSVACRRRPGREQRSQKPQEARSETAAAGTGWLAAGIEPRFNREDVCDRATGGSGMLPAAEDGGGQRRIAALDRAGRRDPGRGRPNRSEMETDGGGRWPEDSGERRPWTRQDQRDPGRERSGRERKRRSDVGGGEKKTRVAACWANLALIPC
jgi:hypothetical protein